MKLNENKESKIRKLKNLTDDQKEELISLFNKYNYLERKIDWNNPDLTYEDFADVIEMAGKSKSSQKKYGIEGLVEGKDYFYFGEGYNSEIGKYKLYQPLTYEGSKVLASNKVEPKVGSGAKWCISYQKSDRHWEEYSYREDEDTMKVSCRFLFVLTEDTKYAIATYDDSDEYDDERYEVYSSEDENLKEPSWFRKDDKIQEVLDNLKDPILPELLNLSNYLVKDPDGTINLRLGDKLSYYMDHKNRTTGNINLKPYVKRSTSGWRRFAVKFGDWDASFDCSGLFLESLEGCPKVVKGNFKCEDNNLTSLIGGPEKVGGHYICSQNPLKSLEGIAKEIGETFHCVDCNFLTNLTGLENSRVRGIYLGSCRSITSLKGCPKVIREDVRLYDLKNLSSFEGAPEEVGGDFVLSSSENHLTDFRGAPKVVGNFRIITGTATLTSVTGSPRIVRNEYSLGLYGNKKVKDLEGISPIIEGPLRCTNIPNFYSLNGVKKAMKIIIRNCDDLKSVGNTLVDFTGIVESNNPTLNKDAESKGLKSQLKEDF